MSPLSLRRFRAERLLRERFDGLRSEVLPALRSKLNARGLRVDDADLEAFYAQAWQGLYATVLAGEEIGNPAGWLVLVAFRRAIDEHRRGVAADPVPFDDRSPASHAAHDGDFAEELDDRESLRRLLEGMSVSLSQAEREAASLCYLQGFSRPDAARRLGISDRKMERLMDGRGARRPGVASKLGVLTKAISEGRYCEERASSMRALAFGILDPEGERYRLAIAHRRDCPACRAYVRSLRGISALLPPVLLRGPAGAILGGNAGAAGVGAGTGSGAGAGAGGVPGSGASGAGPATGGGGVTGGGVAGGGVAGAGGSGVSGWVGAGVSAKLAAAGAAALVLGGGVYALSSSTPNGASRDVSVHRSNGGAAGGSAGGAAGGGAGGGGLAGAGGVAGGSVAGGSVGSRKSTRSGGGSASPPSARRLREPRKRSRQRAREASEGATSTRPAGVPSALREFGIERGAHRAGFEGGPSQAAGEETAPAGGAGSAAQREFGIE